MITFGRGLVLLEGERSMEFERQLEFGKVQFKYLDNFEIRTFSIGGLYCKILAKSIQVVHQNGRKIDLPGELRIEGQEEPLKLEITKRQEAIIDFRMKYVRKAQILRATHGSRKKCQQVIDSIASAPESGEQEKKCALDSDDSKEFAQPTVDTLRNWLKRYVASGCNPYSLMDRRPMARRPKRLNADMESLMEECRSQLCAYGPARIIDSNRSNFQDHRISLQDERRWAAAGRSEAGGLTVLHAQCSFSREPVWVQN